MLSRVIDALRAPVVVCTSGASFRTVIVSSRSPTSRTTGGRFTRSVAATGMSSRTSVLKPDERDPQVVASGEEIDECEGAVCASLQVALPAGRGIRDRDRGAWHQPAVTIGHDASDLRRHALTGDGGRRRAEHKDEQPQDRSHGRFPASTSFTSTSQFRMTSSERMSFSGALMKRKR